MNYVINLFNSYEYNVILTVIYKLLKEKYYVSCFINNENITIKKTVKMLM